MPRIALLPLVVLALLLMPRVALPQTDFKPRPGTVNPPPPPQRTPSRSTADRGRVTERIAIGERAPDFGLDRLDGKTLRLSSLRGNWVVVFFVERRDSLPGVEPVAKALTAIGVRTLAVVHDKTHALGRYLQGRDVPYVPLADPTGDIVALYGLLDDTDGETRPGFVLVDPRGEVRLALLGQVLPPDDASRLVGVAVGAW